MIRLLAELTTQDEADKYAQSIQGQPAANELFMAKLKSFGLEKLDESSHYDDMYPENEDEMHWMHKFVSRLEYYCLMNDYEMIQLMLDLGVVPSPGHLVSLLSKMDNEMTTTQLLTLIDRFCELNDNLLNEDDIKAVQRGIFPSKEEFLKFQTFESYPLTVAIRTKAHGVIIKRLIQHGADPNIVEKRVVGKITSEQATPLSLAIDHYFGSQTEEVHGLILPRYALGVVRLLIEEGADPNLEVGDFQDEMEYNLPVEHPLMQCWGRGSPEHRIHMIQLLYDHNSECGDFEALETEIDFRHVEL